MLVVFNMCCIIVLCNFIMGQLKQSRISRYGTGTRENENEAEETMDYQAPQNYSDLEKLWMVNSFDLIIRHVIGEGAFSRIYLANMKFGVREMNVAVKTLKSKSYFIK